MSSGRSLRMRKDRLANGYNDLNRCKNGQSILFDTHLGSPSSWKSSMRAKLKRLVNNRKGVTQPKLSKKFYKNQRTIGRQIQKLVVNN
jgi:predicted HTH transcriptional regulator